MKSRSNFLIGKDLEKAVACLKEGKYEQVFFHCESALRVAPKNAVAYYLMGYCENIMKQPQMACEHLLSALDIDPLHAEAHCELGNAKRALGLHEQAVQSYDRALSLQPDMLAAHYNRANALKSLGAYAQAVQAYDHVLRLKPDLAQAWVNRGNALSELKDDRAALLSYQRALQLQPSSAVVLFNLGNAYSALRQWQQAISSYESSLRVEAGNPDVLLNLASALHEDGQFDRALALVCSLIEVRPEHAKAWALRSAIESSYDHYGDALQSIDQALQLEPENPDFLTSKGLLVGYLEGQAKAIEWHHRALSLDPVHPEAQLNLANCHLKQSQFVQGWPGWEYRFDVSAEACSRLKTSKLRWNGEGKPTRLLIWPEQGVGDQLFWGGLLRELVEVAEEVIAQLDARLIPLMQPLHPTIRFVSADVEVPEAQYDMQIPFGSLGRLFRNAESDFPERQCYVEVDASHVNSWRQLLAPHGQKLCGVSWKSRNHRIGHHKSLALENLAPCLREPGVVYVNLQYGDVASEIQRLKQSTGIEIVQPKGLDIYNDLYGLAGLMAACDVVLSSSSSTAHLAGALGKDTVLLLPEGKGLFWYWCNQRNGRSLWYPSIRMVKKTSVDALWDEPVAQAAGLLKDLLQN